MSEDLKGCLGLVALAMIVVAVTFAGSVAAFGVHWFVSPFVGAQGARDKIQRNGNFRLQAYDSFYNQCASIQALEGDLDSQVIAYNNPATPANDRRIYSQNITGIDGARSGAISRYNQESHKQWTVAQFKSNALPYELATERYISLTPEGMFKTGVKTQCAI